MANYLDPQQQQKQNSNEFNGFEILEDQEALEHQQFLDDMQAIIQAPLREMSPEEQAELDEQREEAERREQEKLAREQEKQRTRERLEILHGMTQSQSVVKITKKTVLANEYQSKFSTKYNDKKRADKQRNKKSRLFQKMRNTEAFQGLEDRLQENNLKRLNYMLEGQKDIALEDDSCFDIAMFLTDNVQANKGILEGLAKKDGDPKAAMDQMLGVLISSAASIQDIRLDNDKELAANASRLERLSWQVTSFERLMEKHHYLTGLDDETIKGLQDKLEQIRSVVAYYDIRKEIITDPYYMAHYNDELSMDFTAAETEEQRELAKKLLKAHVAGKNMLEKNGASADLLKKQKEPKFKNKIQGAELLQREQAVIRLHSKKNLGKKYDWTEEERLNAKRFMQSRAENAKFASLIHKNDAAIEAKYGQEIQVDILSSQHNYAIPVSNYMEALSGEEFAAGNQYLTEYLQSQKAQGQEPDTVSIAGDLAKSITSSNASINTMQNQMKTMKHVFRTLMGFDPKIFKYDNYQDLLKNGGGMKERLVINLAKEASAMLKDYIAIKDHIAGLMGKDWMKTTSFFKEIDMSEEEFKETSKAIRNLVRMEEFYEAVPDFFGSPIALEVPFQMLDTKSYDEIKRMGRDSKMYGKYGEAWQKYLSDFVIIKNHGENKYDKLFFEDDESEDDISMIEEDEDAIYYDDNDLAETEEEQQERFKDGADSINELIAEYKEQQKNRARGRELPFPDGE